MSLTAINNICSQRLEVPVLKSTSYTARTFLDIVSWCRNIAKQSDTSPSWIREFSIGVSGSVVARQCCFHGAAAYSWSIISSFIWLLREFTVRVYGLQANLVATWCLPIFMFWSYFIQLILLSCLLKWLKHCSNHRKFVRANDVWQKSNFSDIRNKVHRDWNLLCQFRFSHY